MQAWFENGGILLSASADIAVILSAIFIGCQVWFFRKDYRKRNEKAELSQAYQLAHFYSREILPRITAVNYYLEEAEILDLLKNIDSSEYKFFDLKEREALYGNSKIKMIDEKLKAPIPQNIAFTFMLLKSGTPKYVSEKELGLFLMGYQKDKKDYAKKIFLEDIKQQVFDTVGDALNYLEYFAMYMESEVADQEAIYMSLHQTFLEFIGNTYFFIAGMNKHPSHKFFIHVISLYKKWNEKSIQSEENLLEGEQKAREAASQKPKKLS